MSVSKNQSDKLNEILDEVQHINDIDISGIETSLTTIDGKIDTIDTNIDDIETAVSTVNGKIGALTDYVGVPYSFGNNSLMAFLITGYYHVHGQPFVYPVLANNVTLTSAAGAWNNTGNIIEVIPANALNVAAFDLHWVNVSSISNNFEGLIEFFKGAVGQEIKIGSTRIFRTSNFISEGAKAVHVPQQLVNERISCRLSDSTAGQQTCAVSFEGHYYA